MNIAVFLIPLVQGWRGSLDACEPKPGYPWPFVHSKLMDVLDSYISSGNSTSSRARYTNLAAFEEFRRFVHLETSVLDSRDFDGEDCWIGLSLVPLVSESGLSQNSGDIGRFWYNLLAFFAFDWNFWLFEHPWRPLEILEMVSSNLIDFDNCLLTPFISLADSARSLLSKLLPPSITPCGSVEFAQHILTLSAYPNESNIGSVLGLFDSAKIFSLALKQTPHETAVAILTSNRVWQQSVNLLHRHRESLKAHEERVNRGDYGLDYSEQLEIIKDTENAKKSQNEISQTFSAAHSELSRKSLFASFSCLHDILLFSGIGYVTMAGTVLGAMRYHGLNPWEHDLEIVIPEENHWEFLKIVIERSPVIKNSTCVRIIASVRRGYSHKFCAQGVSNAIVLDESPITSWGYPHGDILEAYGWGDSNEKFGIPWGWSVSRETTLSPVKVLMGGGLFWAPRDPKQYLAEYFLSYYNYTDDVSLVCRGHRGTAADTVACSSLDKWFPRARDSNFVEFNEIFGNSANIQILGFFKKWLSFAGISTAMEISTESFEMMASDKTALYFTVRFVVEKRCKGLVVVFNSKENEHYEFFTKPETFKFLGDLGADGFANFGVVSFFCENSIFGLEDVWDMKEDWVEEVFYKS